MAGDLCDEALGSLWLRPKDSSVVLLTIPGYCLNALKGALPGKIEYLPFPA